MPQTITTGYKALCEAAEREIETVPVEQAIARAKGGDVVLVDIRDIRELQRDGKIPGAFHCPRGMLEFWIDPGSPYHKPVFAQDKKYLFFCAGGLRSALAAQTAQQTPRLVEAGTFAHKLAFERQDLVGAEHQCIRPARRHTKRLQLGQGVGDVAQGGLGGEK